MTVAGRTRLFVLLAALAVGLLLWVGAGQASAQATTVAPSSPATTVATAGDDASTRTVHRIVAALVVLAVVLLGVAVWFWRSSKPLPRHLDGLDVMGTRRWRSAGSEVRSVMLGPVHERRSELRDEELIAEPEPEPVASGASEEESKAS